MRALVLAVLAACYAPDVPRCVVRCGTDSPCPADMTCGSAGLCQPAGDPEMCPMPIPIAIAVDGNGAGRVTSMPAGVDCTSDSPGPGCEGISFAPGTQLHLTATPDPGGNTFTGWSGDACAGSTLPDCTFTLDQPATVHARFD